MPAPAKTSDEAIVSAARRIIEQGGIDALSMHAVAEAVAVRPPSLYKRFADRDSLLRTVQIEAFEDLRQSLERVPAQASPRERLRRIADVYRNFARRRRRLYAAMFHDTGDRLPEDIAVRARAAEPLLRAVTELVGVERALPAARLLTAFVHGFVTMELASAFRLGGNVDEAYTFGVDTLIGALTK